MPEALLLQILTLKLMNEKKVSSYKLIKVSVLYGVAAFFIRNIAFNLRQYFLFSLHTILLILVLALLFDLIHKIELNRCFMPLFIISLLYGLIQFTFILIVFKLFNIKVYNLQENPWINIALFFPIAAITYSAVHIYTKYAGETR
mgnify:CR=1 FL=1